MPGVGKTALAVHAAHLLAGRFPDRRLFVDLHGHTPGRDPVTSGEALAVLLAAIGEEPRNLPEDVEVRAALWRDRMAGQRSLVVLDNAASSVQVAPLLPGSSGCLVLVTSRRHLADLPGVVIPVLVEVLPSDHAVRMFTTLAAGASSWKPAQVAELVRLAGHLPLAVSLLARVHARHPAWRADDLIGETRARLLTLSAEHASVAAAFDVSWAHLEPRQQSFLVHLGLHPGTSVDAWSAAALAEVPLEDAARLLDELHAEGLVTETGHRRYGMHDLIRRYAIGRATAAMSDTEREQAIGRLLDYYQQTAAMADAWLPHHAAVFVRESVEPEPPFEVPEFSSSDQALGWARAERASMLACLDQAGRAEQHARVVALTAGLASLLRLDGPWIYAIERHADAVRAARMLGDLRSEARALSSLGDVRVATGDYAAGVQDLEVSLDICRDLGDQLSQVNTLNSLGAVQRYLKDYPAAVKHLEASLSICRYLGDRISQAIALGRLGGVRRCAGDYLGAAQLLEEALGIFRDHDDRSSEAATLNEIGGLAHSQGENGRAMALHQQALDLARQIDSSWQEAHALAGLGRCAGDAVQAETDLRRALEIFRRTGAAGEVARIRDEIAALPRSSQTSINLIRRT